jgi:hypothetical protein
MRAYCAIVVDLLWPSLFIFLFCPWLESALPRSRILPLLLLSCVCVCVCVCQSAPDRFRPTTHTAKSHLIHPFPSNPPSHHLTHSQTPPGDNTLQATDPGHPCQKVLHSLPFLDHYILSHHGKPLNCRFLSSLPRLLFTLFASHLATYLHPPTPTQPPTTQTPEWHHERRCCPATQPDQERSWQRTRCLSQRGRLNSRWQKTCCRTTGSPKGLRDISGSSRPRAPARSEKCLCYRGCCHETGPRRARRPES